MPSRPMPKKEYRLHDGSMGTEYEALKEVLKSLNTKKQELEDKIEEVMRDIALAEGNPLF